MTAEGQHRARLVVQGDAKSAVTELNALSKQVTKLEQELARTQNALAKKNEVLARSTKEAATASGGFQRMEKSLDAMGKRVSLITNVIGGAGLVAALSGAAAAAGAVKDAIVQLADDTARARGVFDNLTISIGPARAATHGLVSDFALATAAANAVSLGVVNSSKGFAELAGLAQKAGARVGRDATQSLEDLSLALGRGSTMILDNLGVTLKHEEAHRIYAERLGKTASQLTDLEKKQAFNTVAMDRLKAATDGVIVKTDGWAASLQRSRVAMENMRLSMMGIEEGVGRFDLDLVTVAAEDLATKGFTKTSDDLRLHGATVDEVREALERMGHSSSDVAKVTNKELAGAYLRAAEKAHELADEAEHARLMAEHAAETFFKDAGRQAQLFELDKEIALLESVEGAEGEIEIRQQQRVQLLIEEAALRGDILQVTKMIQDEELRQVRSAVAAAGGDGGRRRGGGRRSDRDTRAAQIQAELEASVSAAKRAQDELDRVANATLGQRLDAIERVAAAERALLDQQLAGAKKVSEQTKIKSQIADLDAQTRLETEEAITTELETQLRVADEVRLAELEASVAAANRKGEMLVATATSRKSKTGEILRGGADARARGDFEAARKGDEQLQHMAAADAARLELEAERELLEFKLQRATTEPERIQLEAELRDLDHRAKMAQIEEEKRASQDLEELAKQQLDQRRARTQQIVQLATQQAASVGQSLVGMGFAQRRAAEAARAAGESEALARRRVAGETLIGLAQTMAGQAVSHGAQAAAAFITLNPVMGGLHLAAAGVFGAAAGILNSRGNAMLRGTGASAAGVGLSVPSAGGGGSAGAAANNGPSGQPSNIPTSPSSGGGSGVPSIPPAPPAGGGGAKVFHIHLQSLAPTRQTAREIRDEIRRLDNEEDD